MRRRKDGLKQLKSSKMIKSPEELFNERYGEPKDKWDKKAQKYDYHDMIDFAEYCAEYYGFYEHNE